MAGTQLGDFGRKTGWPGDRALGRASGKVADLTELLVPSMPDLLRNRTEFLVGNGDF